MEDYSGLIQLVNSQESYYLGLALLPIGPLHADELRAAYTIAGVAKVKIDGSR